MHGGPDSIGPRKRGTPESTGPQRRGGRKVRAPQKRCAESAGSPKARAQRKRGAFKKHTPRILKPCLFDELLQLSGFLNTEFAKKSLDATDSPAASPAPTLTETCPTDYIAVITKDNDNVILNTELPKLRIYGLLVANNLETVFPNTVIALGIYLSLVISNCSGERLFSTLQRIRHRVRSSMTQKRLNSLTLLSVEQELLRNKDLLPLINDF